MKRILITGGNGQLAQCIKDISKTSTELEFIFTDVEELDITNLEEVSSFFDKNKIDYCINCAAYTAVDKAEEESEIAYKVNAEGPRNLAVACQKNEATLLQISTDFVFDGEKSTPYIEEDKANPISVYGASKLKGEELITQNLERYFIIRTAWLYSEHGANFMKTMLRLGAEREELSVVADQKGSPTYAKDLAEVLMKIVNEESKKYGLYHYSNRGETSWYGFAQAIFEAAEIQIRLKAIATEAYPTPAKRPKFSVMSTSKISAAFDVKIPTWKESLKRALQNLKKEA